MSEANTSVSFSDLGLSAGLTEVLSQRGYTCPTPIQAQAIPPLLNGEDLLGQAQTGTGKTAAFALPILDRIDTDNKATQILVLAPTRELAIQVSESFKAYAARVNNLKVLSIYGGQSMQQQLQALKRGVQIVVGTPGRVMDHLRRKTLKLHDITTVVLDEADEMLKMGFLEDVEWILNRTPEEKQVALFSATMPKPIQRIAAKYQHNAKFIQIESNTNAAQTIDQKFCSVTGVSKVAALTRLLDFEDYEAAIIFVRTKKATIEVAEALERRGHLCAAMNGDLSQSMRERTIRRLKDGSLNIVVATDVAARGLDVARISHVINYDMPFDTESYIHRIGRTGRAGKNGTAILFATGREQRLIRAIERTSKQKIAELKLPDHKSVTKKRVERFKARLLDSLATKDLSFYGQIVDELVCEGRASLRDIAALLCFETQKQSPLVVEELKVRSERKNHREQGRRSQSRGSRDQGDRRRNQGGRSRSAGDRRRPGQEAGMTGYRIEVGRRHGVRPNGIVAAIAENSGISGKTIGRIRLHDNYSTVDLPEGMPRDIFNRLKRARVQNQPMRISQISG